MNYNSICMLPNLVFARRAATKQASQANLSCQNLAPIVKFRPSVVANSFSHEDPRKRRTTKTLDDFLPPKKRFSTSTRFRRAQCTALRTVPIRRSLKSVDWRKFAFTIPAIFYILLFSGTCRDSARPHTCCSFSMMVGINILTDCFRHIYKLKHTPCPFDPEPLNRKS